MVERIEHKLVVPKWSSWKYLEAMLYDYGYEMPWGALDMIMLHDFLAKWYWSLNGFIIIGCLTNDN